MLTALFVHGTSDRDDGYVIKSVIEGILSIQVLIHVKYLFMLPLYQRKFVCVLFWITGLIP